MITPSQTVTNRTPSREPLRGAHQRVGRSASFRVREPWNGPAATHHAFAELAFSGPVSPRHSRVCGAPPSKVSARLFGA